MFKVSPLINQTPLSCTNSTSDHSYTVWMKSLLFSGCGCTIFDSNGEIVYRVDSYNKKCRSQVYLMNLHGKVLLSLRRKKFQIFDKWEGFRWSDNGETMSEKPWFQVRKDSKILKRSINTCHVSVGCGHKGTKKLYKMIGFPGKSEFKIMQEENQLVAEVKRKQSGGVVLGEDVLSLKMEAGLPQIDDLLIMALVIVHGIVNDQL